LRSEVPYVNPGKPEADLAGKVSRHLDYVTDQVTSYDAGRCYLYSFCI
jgi:hypothetical protein